MICQLPKTRFYTEFTELVLLLCMVHMGRFQVSHNFQHKWLRPTTVLATQLHSSVVKHLCVSEQHLQMLSAGKSDRAPRAGALPLRELAAAHGVKLVDLN